MKHYLFLVLLCSLVPVGVHAGTECLQNNEAITHTCGAQATLDQLNEINSYQGWQSYRGYYAVKVTDITGWIDLPPAEKACFSNRQLYLICVRP
jgi:hypothetical protein